MEKCQLKMAREIIENLNINRCLGEERNLKYFFENNSTSSII